MFIRKDPLDKTGEDVNFKIVAKLDELNIRGARICRSNRKQPEEELPVAVRTERLQVHKKHTAILIRIVFITVLRLDILLFTAYDQLQNVLFPV